jgi:hypothetical protein
LFIPLRVATEFMKPKTKTPLPWAEQMATFERQK